MPHLEQKEICNVFDIQKLHRAHQAYSHLFEISLPPSLRSPFQVWLCEEGYNQLDSERDFLAKLLEREKNPKILQGKNAQTVHQTLSIWTLGNKFSRSKVCYALLDEIQSLPHFGENRIARLQYRLFQCWPTRLYLLLKFPDKFLSSTHDFNFPTGTSTNFRTYFSRPSIITLRSWAGKWAEKTYPKLYEEIAVNQFGLEQIRQVQ